MNVASTHPNARHISDVIIPTGTVTAFPDLPTQQPGPPFEFGPLKSWQNTVVGSMETIASGKRATTWLALGSDSFNPHTGFDSLEDAEFAAKQLTAGDKPAAALIEMWGKFYVQSLDTVDTRVLPTRRRLPDPPTTFLEPLELEGKAPADVGVFTFGIPGVQGVIDGEEHIWRFNIQKV